MPVPGAITLLPNSMPSVCVELTTLPHRSAMTKWVVMTSLEYHGRGLVNIIAHKSLLLAYGQGSARITLRQVRAAAKDTPQAHGAGLLARLLRPRWLRFRAAA